MKLLLFVFLSTGISWCIGLNINHGNTRNAVENSPKASTNDIHFYLWTSTNPGDNQYWEIINGDSGRLAASPFDPTLKTYFITHGYTSDGFTGFIVDGKTKILSLEDCNVISIDWEKIAFNVDYWAAANDVYMVGPYVAEFIDWLVSETGASTSDIQMIGHSLGAHVIGLAAQNVFHNSGQIDRLTGLDPAGPAFYDATAGERLDKSQARYVDIIHSNGGELDHSCYGLIDSIGHTDYFPNGGVRQPGCGAAGCSHSRSHDYWLESITAGPDYASGDGATNLIFQGWPCADWDTFDAGSCTSCGSGCNVMGFHNNDGLEGNFYLRSYDNSPFAYGVAQ